MNWEQEGFSYVNFTKCVQEIEKISERIGDSWKMYSKEVGFTYIFCDVGVSNRIKSLFKYV